ncbi:hypothetical protein B4Q13_21825, partial [Lacticaseibacillus rhamnosus]
MCLMLAGLMLLEPLIGSRQLVINTQDNLGQTRVDGVRVWHIRTRGLTVTTDVTAQNTFDDYVAVSDWR